MSAGATITLTDGLLQCRAAEGRLCEDIPVGEKELELLAGWAKRHRELAAKHEARDELLALGEEMWSWLESRGSGFLNRLLEMAQPPVVVDFAVSKPDDGATARAFLDAPWELLAANGQYLALDDKLAFCPVRRIGPAAAMPAAAPPHRLSVVFMAAAPRSADNLDYEAEEARILQATRTVGLDLVVEESGTLELLAACVARETPDVVHISCHGTLKPEPGLLLEDGVGERAFVAARQLVTQLAAKHPPLLVVSACESAQSDPVLDSLARSLVQSGARGVLGWAAPVRDAEATIFAAHLYQRLTAGEASTHALAYARLDLAATEELNPNAPPGERSHDWHLARLYLSPTGGGALATAGGPRRLTGHAAVKVFLDTKGQQVPVAAEREFVGRRRQIQAILRELRAPGGERRAGVLIHGLGRQGKSSLAARVAHRMQHTHELVVVYGRYTAAAMLRAFGERIGTPKVTQIVERYKADVEADATRLLPALTELLEGPCDQERRDADGRFSTRPVLLVIDDFEQALEAQAGGRHRVKPELIEGLRAVLRAFNDAATESRLLVTSRYQFTLPDSAGRELADLLADVPLPGMDRHESRKQAMAKFRVEGEAKAGSGVGGASGLGGAVARQRRARNMAALLAGLDRLIAAAAGNPGLQNLLFTLCLEDAAAGARCLEQMEAYRRTGVQPDAEGLRQFMENLAVGALLGLLAPAQRELLRAAKVFELPVPVGVMEVVAARCVGHGGPTLQPATGGDAAAAMTRLVELGLWDVYPDLFDPREPALALNALVRPLAGELEEAEQRKLAAVVVCPLFEAWGAEGGGKQRRYSQDYELTQLARLAGEARVLAACAADALRFLEAQFEYQKAAHWAREIVALLDAGGVAASIDLLRTAAERCVQIGEVGVADGYRARALELIEQVLARGETVDTGDHAATLITHARALAQQGRPDEALAFFEQAKGLLPPGREEAIVTGEIARLRADKGEVDAALHLHQEALDVVKQLGDKRECAVRMGDIARLRAAKGEVDAALKLHQEALAVYEALGDKRSRAVTLGDIARLRADKGEVDAALKLHQEELAVYEALGDKRSRAVTLGDIARLLAAKGEVDAALKLHQEALAVCGELGDKRGRAVTLGDIARLRADKGEVDAALMLHQEALAVCDELGDKLGRAVTLGDVARLRADKGEVDAPLKLHQERLAVYEALGDKRGRAVTLGDIARLRAAKGEVDAALMLHQERLAVYEALGDKDAIANTLWSIGQIELRQERITEAFEHLSKSYAINLELGRLDGICMVGTSLGQLLFLFGQREQGVQILTRSRDGFVKLGRADMALQTQKLIDQLSALPPSGQAGPGAREE